MARSIQKLICRYFVFLCLLGPSALWAQTDGLTTVTLTDQGVKRSYEIHVPSTLVGKTGVPAVFVFHGGQGDGADIADTTQMAEAGDAAGFISVFPDSYGDEWNDGRTESASPISDVAYIQTVLAAVVAQHGVDPKRIYATGLSSGGMFTQRLACDLASSFRAFGPVAANLPADYQSACKPARPNPMSFFNGTTDPMMPWDGGEITKSAEMGAGGTVLSHSDTMAFWSAVGACTTLAGPSDWPDTKKDGTTITTEELGGCAQSVTMDIYIINDGGHTWPGATNVSRAKSLVVGKVSQQISATNQLVTFFQQYGL
mgnify:CR=1 FL=1